MSDDQTTIGELLGGLHPTDRERAQQSVAGARRELQVAARRLSERADELPDAPGELTVDELDELIGLLHEVGGDLQRSADRAAVALDDLQASGDA
jgi:hypothetical protein